jgi:hypothetical protein
MSTVNDSGSRNQSFKRYCYAPLEKEYQHIRLLTLLPGSCPKPIHITLNTAELSTEHVPKFEALSYTWGSTRDPADILIVDKGEYFVLSITQNLYVALKDLRYQSEPRVLWVDSICINQEDIAERSSQVKLMADIDTLTKRVVVWLGPEADESSLALDLLEVLGTNVKVDWLTRTMKPISKEDCNLHWADRSQDLPFDSRGGLAIVNLLRRSWFEVSGSFDLL